MRGWWLRIPVAAVALTAMLSLGLAESERQFGYLEGLGRDGARILLRGPATAAREGDRLRVTFASEGTSVELLLPPAPPAAKTVEALVRVTGRGGDREGLATLDVQETGSYLAGTLLVELEGVRFEGGLRVRSDARTAAPGAVAVPGQAIRLGNDG